MRKVIFVFLFPFFVHAQDESSYNAALIQPALLENADAVVRFQEITFSVSSAGEATLREKRIVTLVNDKSDYDELKLVYSSLKKIGKIRGSLYDATGNFLRDVEKKEIEDYSATGDIATSVYEDHRLRYLNVGHDKYPYTIMFDYEIQFSDLPTGYPDWSIQQFNTSVEQASFTITMPEKTKLYYKALNTSLEPIVKPGGNKARYLWEVKNLPAIKWEPQSPSPYIILPKILVSPDAFKADNYIGSMASWKAFGQFQYDLAKGRDELSPALKTKVHELIAGAKTESEKIAILYRYMQENTRYVSVQLGIGGWQPFDAQYVEKNKYGDCKALTNFMKALLKEAGIMSYPALVMWGDDFIDVPDDFAVFAFNHAILYVPSQNAWYECTSTNAPPGYLGKGKENRKVLLITEQGGQLARTPAYAPAENVAVRSTEITVTAAGGALISKHTTLQGPLHEWYRDAADQLTPDELKKALQKQNPLPQAYCTRLSVRPDKAAPKAYIEYDLEVPQFGSKAGKRLFLPANPVNAFTDVPPANDQRLHPVEIRAGHIEQDTIVFRYPESYSVESIPAEHTAIETEFGTYSNRVVRQEADRTILFIRRLEMKAVLLPAARYTEWRNFCRDVAKADAMKVVLIQKT